jgi:hypothetical protein
VQQQEIHQFLESYFKANNCDILENQQGHMTVQLNVEVDKELMNRPFYWHYLEKTGGVPNPMKLTFITNKQKAPENIKGEVIHFGSPRLHQIFASTKNLAGYIRLYENNSSNTGIQTPLIPWLGLNFKISYQCDRKRDIFQSIGLQLINGRIVEDFHDNLLTLPMKPKIPDYAYTLSPLIKPKSGLTRIHSLLNTRIEQEDASWAEDAKIRWKKDLDLLHHFYEDSEDKSESFETEKIALQEQYEPKIIVSIVNGGLFYLTEKAL